MTTSVRLTESDLVHLWRGQRFPEGALVTRAGVAVRVVAPGRCGRGPGPDFRNAAVMSPSGVILRGDIELHVRASLFRAHGHSVDPAYRNIVLHVVFEDDDGEDTMLPGGKTAPVVALAPWVARRADELRRWLDRPMLWMEPCHDAVTRLGADAVMDVLDREGDRRFDDKVCRWRSAVEAEGTDQALYAGFLRALGYGGNAASMQALAAALPWSTLSEASRRDADRMTALLLGVAGLLPEQRGNAGPAPPAVADMSRIYAASGLASAGLPWKLWGVRPENHPARRIAAAAQLFTRLGAPSRALDASAAHSTRDAIESLLVPASGFWRDHHDVCAPPARLPAALIGRSRALELLINVVLPAAAAGGDDAATAARTQFGGLPRPGAYGRTRFLENALTPEGARVRINARRAQGMLALHADWCTQDGCGRCPLS